jgi:hypothetical protein
MRGKMTEYSYSRQIGTNAYQTIYYSDKEVNIIIGFKIFLWVFVYSWYYPLKAFVRWQWPKAKVFPYAMAGKAHLTEDGKNWNCDALTKGEVTKGILLLILNYFLFLLGWSGVVCGLALCTDLEMLIFGIVLLAIGIGSLVIRYNVCRKKINAIKPPKRKRKKEITAFDSTGYAMLSYPVFLCPDLINIHL